MWTCVERRESEPFGKMLRNVIFTDLYENEGRKDLIFGLFKMTHSIVSKLNLLKKYFFYIKIMII